MLYNYILICLSVLKLISCDKSFTIVLDTSGSMSEELDVIKTRLTSVINPVDNSNIGDFILVPFSNPVVSEPIITPTFSDLMIAINRVTLSRGGDCPEVVLSGIEKALEVSKPRSQIFVFTDAFPNDIDKIRSIESLCRTSLSQVVIFLTGFCANSPLMTVQAYRDVATACSGAMFQLNTSELRRVFKYIKEAVTMRWNDVVSYDSFQENKEISFTVNSFTKSVLLVASGPFVQVALSKMDNQNFNLENIFVSRNAKVVHLRDASPGEYKVNITSESTASLILYKMFLLPLQFGFSTVQSRNLMETSRRPMPGRNNNILLNIQSDFQLESVAIQIFNEDEKKVLPLEQINVDQYLTSTFIDPDRSFRIWVYGTDKATFQKVTASTESVIPQTTVIDSRWMEPHAGILEGTSVTVKYGTKATVACKVVGYPKPNVWWEDNQSTLSTSPEIVLLEIPSVYISYYNIDNATSNTTLYCKCQNSKGKDSQRIDVYVYRPSKFEVLQSPQDQSIEYGTEGKLFCEVNAYPEAEIKWYHNNSLITLTNNFEILPQENALIINYMTLNDVGEYKCEISNSRNSTSYAAEITISGLEAPQVEVNMSSDVLVLGDSTYLECRVVKGKPSPEISWKYQPLNGLGFSNELPENVTLEDNKLKITDAKKEHSGIYRCGASNIEGHHDADKLITAQYPPVILNNETMELVVKADNDIVLECDVDASPAAEVWLEKVQEDGIRALDYTHNTDVHHSFRFKVTDKDSGDYHWIAQNSLGRARKTITLKVLVKPYIEAPQSDVVTVRAGGTINLACNILVGNPVPATKWQFIALDSTTRTLHRGNASIYLHMTDVRHSNEGWYWCIADNDIGTDSIKVYVKVQ